MKIKIILLLIAIVILLSACASVSQYTDFFSSGSSSGSGKGFMVSFTQAPESGSKLSQFDTFSVVLDLSNYMVSQDPVFAKVCLSDSTSDSYSGIPSNECREVTVSQAEQVNKNFFPGKEQIRFPSQGFYKYEKLDRLSVDNQIFANVFYKAKTEAGSIACVSIPNLKNAPKNCIGQSRLNVQQQESPLKVSNILVTPNAIGENEVKLNIEITLSKERDTEVYKPSNSLGSVNSQNEGARIEVTTRSSSTIDPVSCRGVSQNIIDFKKDQNEKVIKCSTSIRLSQEFDNIPIIIDLEYQVHKIIEGPKFTLKREEET